MPSSSIGPNVICSGVPSGNFCRQRWHCLQPLRQSTSTFRPETMQLRCTCPGGRPAVPQNFHQTAAADTGHQMSGNFSSRRQEPICGPGTRRSSAPSRFRAAENRSGRDSARPSVAVTIPMWKTVPMISENRTRESVIQVRPEALGRSRAGWPPSTGTVHVSQEPAVTFVYAIREPSGENTGPNLRPSSLVSRYRLAIREQLDVDLAGAEEELAAANECHHSPVR